MQNQKTNQVADGDQDHETGGDGGAVGHGLQDAVGAEGLLLKQNATEGVDVEEGHVDVDENLEGQKWNDALHLQAIDANAFGVDVSQTPADRQL